MRHYSDTLSLHPLVKEVRNYTKQKARADLFAAVSVAFLSIPQALAYSIVAGVPPAAGIIAMVLGTIIAALLGSSRHLVVGPNNASSLLVQAAGAEIFQKLYTGTGLARVPFSLELLMVLTFFIGATQLLAAVFRLGRLIQFVSHSVVVGYLVGTACVLTVGQLFPFTGIICPEGLETLYEKVVYWLWHLGSADLLTVAIGLVSLLLLLLFRRVGKILPPALSMLSLVACFVALFNFRRFENLSLLSWSSEGIVPVFGFPNIDFRLLNILLPISFAIALIGMLEANAIGKAIAATTGQRLNKNQEIFALGLANVVLSFFGALPCSGSSSRSALNLQQGAQTRFSGVFSGIFVGGIVFFFGSVIQYIPCASLAALLIATAVRMIDFSQVTLCFRATRSDATVLAVTFLSCFFFSLPLAFYMGVALSLILYLRKAAIPRVAEYTYDEMTKEFHPASDAERKTPHPFRIINAEGELFFGSMDLFQSTLRAIAEDDVTTKVIILRLKHVHDVDATTALALRQLKAYLDKSQRHLIVCSVPSHVLELLENAHLTETLGAKNIIPYDDHAPHAVLEKAIARAREILASLAI